MDLDQDSKDTNTASENLEAEDATVVEASSETHGLSASIETDQGIDKKNAVEKMDQSLKLLQSPIDTISRDESTKNEEGSTKYSAPAAISHELMQSSSNSPSKEKCSK